MKKLLTTLLTAGHVASCTHTSTKTQALTQAEKTHFSRLDAKAIEILREFALTHDEYTYEVEFCKLLKDLDINRYSIYVKENSNQTGWTDTQADAMMNSVRKIKEEVCKK